MLFQSVSSYWVSKNTKAILRHGPTWGTEWSGRAVQTQSHEGKNPRTQFKFPHIFYPRKSYSLTRANKKVISGQRETTHKKIMPMLSNQRNSFHLRWFLLGPFRTKMPVKIPVLLKFLIHVKLFPIVCIRAGLLIFNLYQATHISIFSNSIFSIVSYKT